MSYHRGGHSGAVAVSYSTSTMSPLSPSRRFSGSTGSSASVTSGTNGAATSKYSNYRSSTPSNLGGDRNGGYYSSASNNGYRASSYTSSTSLDTFRQSYYSPVRSVSSYNESSSIVGSSSISSGGFRYGSASTSSGSSSTGSSNSSCTSRDRSSLQHHTPGRFATTADLYAIYSPNNYVPNIHSSKSSNVASHWRPSSSASSSGISSSLVSELHGGDEYDSCRERRERSYSSETSSGIGLSSNTSTSSSINQNSLLPNSNDRWTTRREINKRRAIPSIGISNVAVNNQITGNANKTDFGSSKIEVVTPETEEQTRKSYDRRDNGLSKVKINVPRDIGQNDEISSIEDNTSVSLTKETSERIAVTRNNDNRDLDNNNADVSCDTLTDPKNTNDDRTETIIVNDRTFGETRRRRRRENVEFSGSKDHSDDRLDDRNDRDEKNGRKNLTIRERNDRDSIDEGTVRERGIVKIDKRENFRTSDHHHQRKRHSEQTSINELNNRKNDVNIPNLSSFTDNPCNSDAPSPIVDITSSVASLTPSSLSSSASSSLSTISQISDDRSNNVKPNVSSLTSRTTETDNNDIPNDSSPVLKSHSKQKNIDETRNIGNLKISIDSYDCNVDNVGGGSGGGVGGGVGGVGVGSAGGGAIVVDSSVNADNHRKALTRTKIPTNNDNTELLTNNNVQDHEDNLGIVETTRNIGNDVKYGLVNETSSGTRHHERQMMIKGARKSLLWTATNEIDDDDDVSNNDNNGLTNGDETKTNTTNGLDRSIDNDDTNLSVYDLANDDNNVTSNIVRNGVRSIGNRNDDMEKASTSRRTMFGWNDPTIDDLNGAPSSSSSSSSSSTVPTASSSAASSSNATNSVPVAVHQNLYRGLNEQIDESSNSRRSRLQSRRDERYGLNGLRNIGNTCFMNSVIQCLSNTRPLLEYLLNEQHLQDINTTTSGMKGALIKAFGQVIQELWEMSGDHVINTTALKSQIQRFAPRFMGYSQQDAQEFLRYLLEGLHEDVNRVTVKPQPILTDIPDHYTDSHKASESWKRYLRSEDSMIVDIFVGQLRSSLHCTACDHVSVTLDPFWDLSLPIPMRLGTVKLNQCLEHFTKVETLDGDEKPTCSKCQMRRKCTKSFSIQKFPKILVIHLKRFSPTERFRGKLSVLVDFPLTGLDLSAFAAPGVQGCTYNLYGVANHSGTTYSGHYTAYGKHPYSSEWHEYNDSRVSSVPARSVVSSEAYVLFYEQQPPSPHL